MADAEATIDGLLSGASPLLKSVWFLADGAICLTTRGVPR
jgi:hypothetical protein